MKRQLIHPLLAGLMILAGASIPSVAPQNPQ